MVNYKNKYIKYKLKYKKLLGGMNFKKDSTKININVNDLFTDKAFREFIDSKLYYSESNLDPLDRTDLVNTARSYETNPDSYMEHINKLLEENKLQQDTVRDNITTVLTTIITTILRPYIYEIISDMNVLMKHYGQFIISGGEAFNLNVPKIHRKLTPDIDTKFIPFFGTDYKETEKFEYIGLILKMRVYFWYEVLEEVLTKMNNDYRNLYQTLLKPMEDCLEFSILKFKFLQPEQIDILGQPFRKRLSLIPKNSKAGENVFFDINLFAIDLFTSNYPDFKGEMLVGGPNGLEVVSKANISSDESGYIAGVLDCPFMRPDEFGYEISKPGNNISINVYSALPQSSPFISPHLLSNEQIRIIINNLPTGLDNPPPNLNNPERVQLLRVILELIEKYGVNLPDETKKKILEIVSNVININNLKLKYLERLRGFDEELSNRISEFIPEKLAEFLNYASTDNMIQLLQIFGGKLPQGYVVDKVLTNQDLVNLLKACNLSESLLIESQSCLARPYSFPHTNTYTSKPIIIASKKFLKEDIDTLIKMNLRSGKSAKDEYRQKILKEIGLDSPTQIINEVKFKIPPNIPYETIESVVYKDNLHRISLSKVLKIIAPPTIKNDENDTYLQSGIFDLDIIEETFNSLKVKLLVLQETFHNSDYYLSLLRDNTYKEIVTILSGPHGEIVKDLLKKNIIKLVAEPIEVSQFLNDEVVEFIKENSYIDLNQWYHLIESLHKIYEEEVVGKRFNYEGRQWVDCCLETPNDDTCCDPIGNQFKLRIKSKNLSFFFYKTTPKVKEMMNKIFLQISSHIDNILKIIDNPDKVLEIKNNIGKMFYEYNPNYAQFMHTSDILDNVLMTAQSLLFVEDVDLSIMSSDIISKLLELRSNLDNNKRSTRSINPVVMGAVAEGEVEINASTFIQELTIKIFKKNQYVYKAMDNIPSVEANIKLKLIGRNTFEPTFYTTEKEVAAMYQRTNQEWAIFKCTIKNDVKLIDLTNKSNLTLLLQNKILKPNVADKLKFMFGYNMTIAEQYNKFKSYATTFELSEDEYGPILDITDSDIRILDLSNDNTKKDILKRCSIYELDHEVIKALCLWFSKKGKDLDINGFYIGKSLPTYYCMRNSEFCDKYLGRWHDEIIFCNRGKNKHFVECINCNEYNC